MFCQWCGKKILEVGRPCPYCGKEQDPLETGTGFWDLCSKKETNTDNGDFAAVINETSSEDINKSFNQDAKTDVNVAQVSGEKESGSLKIIMWIAFLFASISTVISVVNLIKTTKIPSDIGELRTEIDNTKEENNLETKSLRANLEDTDREQQELRKLLEAQLDNENGMEVEEEITDESESEDLWWDSDSIEKGDNFVRIYETDISDAGLMYVAEDLLTKDDIMKTCWQISNESDGNWETVKEDSYCYVPDDADALCRFLYQVNEKTIYTLTGEDEDIEDIPMIISKETVRKGMLIYTVEDSEGYEYEWRISPDGKNWNTISDTQCIVHLDNKFQYQIAVLSTQVYEAGQIEDGEEVAEETKKESIFTGLNKTQKKSEEKPSEEENQTEKTEGKALKEESEETVEDGDKVSDRDASSTP